MLNGFPRSKRKKRPPLTLPKILFPQAMKLVLTIICTLLTYLTQQVKAQTINSNKVNKQGGYTYEYWKDKGTGKMTLGPEGTFDVSWRNIGNLLARKGLRPGSKNQVVTYTADYQPNGNSYLGVYGWLTSPLVEYYGG
jgi:endo-1,4-beta-xylanase